MATTVVREPSLADPERSARALLIHRFFFRFALGSANVFAWIFVFQYFYLVEPDNVHALVRTALLYALSQIVTCLVTPYAARALRKGARRAIFIASLLAAAAYVLLGSAFAGFWGGSYMPFALAIYAIALGLYRAFYWIPYEVEAAVSAPKRRFLWSELVIALAPFVAGIYIASSSHGPVLLLYMSAGLIAFSMLPVFRLRDIHEGYRWGYRETFARLLEPENRHILTHAYAEGIVGAALLLFWPLTVFLITGWSYGMLGIVLSLTFIVAILGRSLVRSSIRRSRLHHSRMLTTVLAVTPWLFRIVVGTPLGVIFVDSYFYTTTPRRLGVDPLAFEQSADSGSYVDEHTALKEIALGLGRITMCFMAVAVALWVSFPIAFIAVFVVAALVSAIAALAAR